MALLLFFLSILTTLFAPLHTSLDYQLPTQELKDFTPLPLFNKALNIGMDHGGGHGGHGGGGGGDDGGGGGGGGGGGDHGGHGGDDMTCSMNMLFNWSTENLCVVFESWRINTPFALVLSCLIIIAMSASYELLRAQSRQFEERLIEGDRKRHAESRGAVGGGIAEDETPLLSPRPHVLR